MAKGLTIETDVQPRRSDQGGNNRPAEGLNPYGYPAQGFQSLEVSADKIANEIHKTQLLNDSTRVVKAEGEANAKNAAAFEKLDPLAKDFMQQVTDLSAANKQEAMENAGLSTREAKGELEARLTRHEEALQLVALSHQKKSVNEEAIRTVDTASNILFQDIRKNPGNKDALFANFQGDADRLTAGMDPDTRRKIEYKLKSDALVTQALGYGDRGQFDTARSILTSNDGSIDKNQSAKADFQLHQIEGKMRADSARSANLSGVHTDMAISAWANNPDPLAEPPVTHDQIKKMVNSNAPHVADALDKALYHAENSRKAAFYELNSSMNAVKNGVATQKNIDTAWDYMENSGLGGKRKSGAGPDVSPEGLERMLSFAKQAGGIPTAFTAYVNNVNSAVSPEANDPQSQAKLAAAANAYKTITDVLPNHKWPGDADNAAAPVQAVAHLISKDNIDPMEAARRVIALTPKDQQATMARDQAFDQSLGKAHGSLTKTDYLQQQVVGAFKTQGSILDVIKNYAPFTRSITTTPDVAKAFEEEWRTAYRSTNDMASAKEIATKRMGERFAVTGVGGDAGRVTEYAPEQFVPQTLSGRVAPDALSGMLNEYTQKALKNAGMPSELKDFRWSADTITINQANEWRKAQAGGGGPVPDVTFRLQVRDAMGGWQDAKAGRLRIPNEAEIRSDENFLRIEQVRKDADAASRGQMIEGTDRGKTNAQRQALPRTIDNPVGEPDRRGTVGGLDVGANKPPGPAGPPTPTIFDGLPSAVDKIRNRLKGNK